jgi:IS5 family transposase
VKLFLTPEDLERNRKKAEKIGSPLERLETRIPWEMFRPALETAINSLKEPAKGPGGRPAFDLVLMFKITILQRIYNISDEQIEYQILDRLSFQKFLGLGLDNRVPDEKTVWHFKNQLAKAGAGKKIFNLFNDYLKDNRMILQGGMIVDASFIEKPNQHFTKSEKDALDQEKVPEGWEKPENQAKVRQKDTDARWTKKYSRSYFGYKDHVKVDAESKLIMDYVVTDAAVHDSQVISQLVTSADSGNTLYADSAYDGTSCLVRTVICKVDSQVHERAYRNTPLTEEQKAKNREKSRIRARVEHVFGFMENSMNGMRLRTIGLARTELSVGLMNLVYNFFRYECLQRG